MNYSIRSESPGEILIRSANRALSSARWETESSHRSLVARNFSFRSGDFIRFRSLRSVVIFYSDRRQPTRHGCFIKTLRESDSSTPDTQIINKGTRKPFLFLLSRPGNGSMCVCYYLPHRAALWYAAFRGCNAILRLINSEANSLFPWNSDHLKLRKPNVSLLSDSAAMTDKVYRGIVESNEVGH